jgi:hypothetical protein
VRDHLRDVAIKQFVTIESANESGQCCVAMITNRPLNEIIRMVGKRGFTKTKPLARILRHYGYECGNVLQRLDQTSGAEKNSVQCALVKVVPRNLRGRFQRWDWVIKCHNKVYDPKLKQPVTWDFYTRNILRPTSWLVIRKGR